MDWKTWIRSRTNGKHESRGCETAIKALDRELNGFDPLSFEKIETDLLIGVSVVDARGKKIEHGFMRDLQQ